jgi:hypothetical protein
LTKTVEEITLIFLRIGCSLKSRRSLGSVDLDIVARGHKIDPAFLRELHETPQFDALIAPDTGIRGCAVEIAGNEVVDHTHAKGFSGVDYFMRNFQCLSHMSSNADLATPTLFPPLRDRDCFVFVFPHLKRDSLNVVALANQKRGGNRAVHSTTHAKKNGRSNHRVAIVLGRQEKG